MSLKSKVFIICTLCTLLFVSYGFGEESIRPYLLPDDHPMAAKLDQIFQESAHVKLNAITLKQAGFKIISGGAQINPHGIRRERVYVLSHPDLKGYLVKLYTDEQLMDKQIKEEKTRLLLNRLKGAKKVREVIDSHKSKHFFKVPKKWAYQLPTNSEDSDKRLKFSCYPVLLVEDMNLVHRELNIKMWKSELVTPEILDVVYTIVRGAGLKDLQTSNIPFSKDGKLCFVDLEQHGCKCRYKHLGKRLSPEMRCYWMSLFKREKELKRSNN